MPIFEDYKLDTSQAGRALPNRVANNTLSTIGSELVKYTEEKDNRKTERDLILSKPNLAAKIRDYQNSTDVNNEDYIEGVRELVSSHYEGFSSNNKQGSKFIREQELSAINAYQTAAGEYQQATLRNQDNAKIETYLSDLMNQVTDTGIVPKNSLKDIRSIINLSDNIPQVLKAELKKNAINDLRTTEIQAGIQSEQNVEELRDKLKSYKKSIESGQYKSLHKQLSVYEKNIEKQRQIINDKMVKGFQNKLTGYTSCVTTGNCPTNIINMGTEIASSGVDSDSEKALTQRFDDITELSQIMTQIANYPTQSAITVSEYISAHTDENANNARRNNILRKYYNEKTSQFKKDPVQFMIDNNSEVLDLLDQVEAAEGVEKEKRSAELRDTIAVALDGKSNRVLANSEINAVGKIEDYRAKVEQIKHLVEQRGAIVIDELIDGNVLTNDHRAITNMSDTATQYKVFGLLRDEKELKDTYKGTDNSYEKTLKELRSKGFVKDFLDSMRYKDKGIDYVNSVTKLTILDALRTGDFDTGSYEKAFNSMLGDYHIVDKMMIPKVIPEEVAMDRIDNVKDAEFLTKTLKKVDGFTGKSLLGGLPNEFKKDAIKGFADDVESGEIEPMMVNGNIVFTKDGKYIRDDEGYTLEIPFDDLDTPDIKIKPRGQMKRRLKK
jgi:hypothetical protein